jgi:hypothetical protein
MRALLSKVTTGAMIAGAALLVTACGGENAQVNNTATMEMNTLDPMMDGTTNDVTAIDAGTGADTNMAMDTNMTMDANTSTNATDADVTNGM